MTEAREALLQQQQERLLLPQPDHAHGDSSQATAAAAATQQQQQQQQQRTITAAEGTEGMNTVRWTTTYDKSEAQYALQHHSASGLLMSNCLASAAVIKQHGGVKNDELELYWQKFAKDYWLPDDDDNVI